MDFMQKSSCVLHIYKSFYVPPDFLFVCFVYNFLIFLQVQFAQPSFSRPTSLKCRKAGPTGAGLLPRMLI